MKPALITILRCDAVPEPDRGRFGDTEQRMERHLRAAAGSAGLSVRFAHVDLYGGARLLPDAPGDLFVITGSDTVPWDDAPWVRGLRAWARDAVAGGRRIYGICFGHQVLAQALGGDCDRDPMGWSGGCLPVTRVAGPDRCGRESAGEEPWHLLRNHRDRVVRLPPGARRWLQASACVEQGMLIGRTVVTVQGHPEHEPQQIAAGFERRRVQLGDGAVDAALATLARPDDGLELSRRALRWLLADPA